MNTHLVYLKKEDGLKRMLRMRINKKMILKWYIVLTAVMSAVFIGYLKSVFKHPDTFRHI